MEEAEISRQSYTAIEKSLSGSKNDTDTALSAEAAVNVDVVSFQVISTVSLKETHHRI